MKRTISIFAAKGTTLALALLAFRSHAIDILVWNKNDNGAGSLRQAIHDNEALGGGNTILFANTVTGTIALTTTELAINANLSILGPGVDLLTVSGNSRRVFNISAGAVALSGLTITRGNSGEGGAVYNSGTLTVSNCLFTTNIAYDGGALFSSGSLSVSHCAFVNNSAGRNGGAVYLTNGTGSLYNTTIASNTASMGGGIYNTGILALTSCTIVTNDASFAGGLYGPATIRNTIIAANGFANGIDGYDDVYGMCISQGYNMIGNTNGSTGWGAVGDQGGSTGSPLTPALLPLGKYGSSLPTMPPAFGSSALDHGKSFGLKTDQRGRLRPYTNNPFGSVPPGGDYSDIGAAEISPATLLVTTTNDAGSGSLRELIVSASSADNDKVTFAGNVTNTITLINGPLIVSKDISIVGPGAGVLIISGNNVSRVFSLFNGEIRLSGLTIANGFATFEGGGIFLAGGYHTISECSIASNVVSGAFSSGGGLAATSNANLTLLNCSVMYNQAGFMGGGIGTGISGPNDLLSITLYNCTIASNRVTDPPETFYWPRGGGIARGAALSSVLGCTVAGNSSTYFSGGIDNSASSAGSIDVRNSIVAGNSAGNAAPDVGGLFTSSGYNLIGNSAGSAGFTNATDQVNVDPLLGPLSNYGGPTPTMTLRAGSPAMDKGQAFGFAGDQRGFARTLDDLNVPNASGGDGTDIGAFETDPNFRIVDLRVVGSNAAMSLMTVLGRNYGAEFRNDLISGIWTNFSNNAAGNGYLLWVTNFGGGNPPQRFYRGVRLP